MKIKVLALSLALVAALATGCSSKPAATTTDNSKSTTTTTDTAKTDTTKTDAVAAASVTDNIDVFQKAISKDGKWIIAITKDLSTDKELVVDGDFKNGKKDAKGNETFQRKIALYTQDDKRNVTARFTLTAPKITFNSVYGSLEHGIFKGDVYVAGKNFKLVDQKVDGNIYFLNADAQSTFTKDDKSTVTGKIELKAN